MFELRDQMLALIDEELERWKANPLSCRYVHTDTIRANIRFYRGERVFQLFGCEKWNTHHRGVPSALKRIRDAVEMGYADESLKEFF